MDLDHRESNKQHFNAQIGILLLPVLINLMQVLIGYKVEIQRLHRTSVLANELHKQYWFKMAFQSLLSRHWRLLITTGFISKHQSSERAVFSRFFRLEGEPAAGFV